MRALFFLPGLLAGCVFFHTGEGGSGTTGVGGAGTATSSGGAGAGGAGAGGPDVCGDGNVTASEECDDDNSVNGDGCSDNCTFECVGAIPGGELTNSDQCGAACWDCGEDSAGDPLACMNGVCAATTVVFSDQRISGLLVEGETVILQRGLPSGDVRVTHLEVISVETLATAATHVVGDYEGSNGVGFLASGGPDRFFYAPQLPVAPPALVVCPVGTGTCDPKNVRSTAEPGLTSGHVNGLVRIGDGANARLFMLFPAQSAPSKKLAAISAQDCVMDECDTVVAQTNVMQGVAISIPLHLDVQILNGGPPTLWWTTFNYADEGCLHRVEVESLPDATTDVPCEIPQNGIFQVTVAGANVFFGTGENGIGPIHRVWDVGGTQLGSDAISSPGMVGNVIWPADTDPDVLYAAGPNSQSLVALKPDQPMGPGMTVVGSTPVGTNNEKVTAVDASHPRYVFFATSDSVTGNAKLYRWRKPAAGYAP